MSNGFRNLVGAADLIGGGYGEEIDSLFGGRQIVVGAGDNPAMQQLAMRNATSIVDVPPTKSRRYPLGFPTTPVTKSGGTAAASTQPQIPFRGERLVIPSDFAGALLITDVKVGKNSQLAAANPLPARAFTEFGWGIDMHLDTADISQFITLNLTNTSGADVTFNALFIGRAVE